MAIEMTEKPKHKQGSSPSGSSHGEFSDGWRYNNGKANPTLEKVDTIQTPPKNDDSDAIYQHLPADQAEILKRQVDTPQLTKGAGVIYRYASRNDIIILVVSAIAAIASGAALPLMTVIFGNLQQTFQKYFYQGGELTYDDFVGELNKYVLYFVYLGIGEFVVTYICTVGFIYTGENISAKIREHYLESCMRQNIGFFDKVGAGEVTTRITADTNLIQDGISEKVSLTLAALATFITAFIISFVNYWKLTLILCSAVFALIFNIGIGSSFMLKHNKASLESYAQGGTIAEEVISSIRNAIAFGTQERLAKNYDNYLAKAEYYGFRVKSSLGVMVGGMMLILFLNYGLAFWQGSKFLLDGVISLSKVLIIMMSVMIGAFNLGNVTPNIQAFTTAIAAAAKIYNTIDRVSPLDPSNESGHKIEPLQGNIRLEHIRHIYPSRPEVVVMDDVTLDIPAGKTTALVGASGSGKSTIVGLVERFYDPVEGYIYLDGEEITDLNLKWLRQQMALVSQEPTLFGTTIFHNIRYGLVGTAFENESEERQRELVIGAAIKANAHDFVSALPEGYETHVGERGFLLSGGQKQRIAIARAIVSDPKSKFSLPPSCIRIRALQYANTLFFLVLLLDEATSALDTKSEGVVQAALENAAAGRTTIVIAHRLSTIKDAHNIVVMSNGRIVEQGTHDNLIEQQGAYYKLVSAQNIAAAEELTAEEEAELEEQEEILVRRMSTRPKSMYAGDPDDDVAAKLRRSSTQKSISSVNLQKNEGEGEQKDSLWTLIKLIASFNAPEWQLMLFGCFWCVICGGGNPVSAGKLSQSL
jgi:ATP-binding cassette subfamily B (MDR/TAP) protein 1